MMNVPYPTPATQPFATNQNQSQVGIYYDDNAVYITTRFVRVLGSTYPLEHVVSVSYRRRYPNYIALIAAAVGVMILPSLIIGGVLGSTVGGLVTYFILLILAIIAIFVIWRPKHIFRASFSSGETERVSYRQEETARQAVNSLLNAVSQNVRL